MDNFGIFTVSTVLLLLSQPLSLFAIDIEGAKESPCFEIKKTVATDIEWVMSIKTWYYPLMSRFDLYTAAIQVSGENAGDLSEDALYYDFCPKFVVETGSDFVAKGFGDKRKPYGVKPIKGMEIYEFYIEGKPEEGATCYSTLTDNKSFVVAACCIGGEQMTWAAMSSVKTLPKETVKEIYDHVESLGFKKEFFTGMRYGQCDKKIKGKNEL